jgi:hypothetical protein
MGQHGATLKITKPYSEKGWRCRDSMDAFYDDSYVIIHNGMHDYTILYNIIPH